MKPKIGKPCRRFVVLALALSACVMQVFCGSLPSLVVCHRGDRPPRVEFFSDSCSCRQEEIHSCSDQNKHAASCLGEACTDVHLKSHVLCTSRSQWRFAFEKSPRRSIEPERYACAYAAINLRPVADDRGAPRAESPPPLSLIYATFRLRC